MKKNKIVQVPSVEPLVDYVATEHYRLGVYDKLRSAHSLIKDVMFGDLWPFMDDADKNAIEAIHSVLYLSEGHFASTKYRNKKEAVSFKFKKARR